MPFTLTDAYLRCIESITTGPISGSPLPRDETAPHSDIFELGTMQRFVYMQDRHAAHPRLYNGMLAPKVEELRVVDKYLIFVNAEGIQGLEDDKIPFATVVAFQFLYPLQAASTPSVPVPLSPTPDQCPSVPPTEPEASGPPSPSEVAVEFIPKVRRKYRKQRLDEVLSRYLEPRFDQSHGAVISTPVFEELETFVRSSTGRSPRYFTGRLQTGMEVLESFVALVLDATVTGLFSNVTSTSRPVQKRSPVEEYPNSQDSAFPQASPRKRRRI